MRVFTYKGSVKATHSPKEWGYAVTEGASKAIYDFMLDVAREAAELAPVKTGKLRSSAEISDYGDGGYKVVFSAINPYNGYDYAAIQHENMDYVHLNGGQAKYLEQPFNQMKGELAQRMAESCTKYAKGKGSSRETPESFGNTTVVNKTKPRGSRSRSIKKAKRSKR